MPESVTRSGDSRWWQHEWVAPAVLALLPLVVFLRAALMRGVFYGWDVQAYFYPYHVLPAALLKHGHLPLWNPFAFSGIPLFGDGQTALSHPASWLFLVLPGGAAMNYSILLQFSVAGVGMYFLARSLGLRRMPAFLGATTYMFCGSLTARVMHLSILSGAALLPSAILCVERGIRSLGAHGEAPSACRSAAMRWLVLGALVVATQVFAGHPQVPVYTGLAIGLYAGIRAIERSLATGDGSWFYRIPAYILGIYALGLGLAAIQLVPWAETGALSTRAAGVSFDVVFGTSMARSDWLLEVFPYLYEALRAGPFADHAIAMSPLLVRFVEHSAYAGILPLGLTVYALLGWWRRTERGQAKPPAFYSVLYLAAVAIVGLLLAAGWATPLAHVVYRTPVIGKLRAVERAMVLVAFAIAGLAAFGLQQLIESPTTERRRRWSPIAVGVVTAAVPLAVVLLAPHAWFQRLLHFPPQAIVNLRPGQLNATLPLLLAFASAVLFVWWSRRPATRVTQALAAALVLVDVGGYAAFFNPIADPKAYDRRPGVLEALRDEPKPFRKATFFRRSDVDSRTPLMTLAMSWGMVFGVEDVNGFNSLQPRRYTDYLYGPEYGDVSYGLLEDERLLRPESPILSSLNVRYVLVPAGMPLRIGAGYRRVFADADVVVYENTLAWPRAFFAESVRGMTDAPAVRRAVTADGFDGRRLALVESAQAPALPAPAAQDRVTITAWDANRISLATDAGTPRFLVLSEMYSPGWQANVDSAVTTIYRTNYLFRGVVVPAGRHTVTFVYRPLSIMVGAGVSALALVAAALLLRSGRRRAVRSASTPPDAGT